VLEQSLFLEGRSLFGERQRRPINEGVVVERNIDKVDRSSASADAGSSGRRSSGGGSGRCSTLDERSLFDAAHRRLPRPRHGHSLALLMRRTAVTEEASSQVAEASR